MRSILTNLYSEIEDHTKAATTSSCETSFLFQLTVDSIEAHGIVTDYVHATTVSVSVEPRDEVKTNRKTLVVVEEVGTVNELEEAKRANGLLGTNAARHIGSHMRLSERHKTNISLWHQQVSVEGIWKVYLFACLLVCLFACLRTV